MARFLRLESGGRLLLESGGGLLLEYQPDVPPAPSAGVGGGGFAVAHVDRSRDERIKDRAALRRMLERAVLGIEDAPPSPAVAQAEQLLAPYRRPDDTVNTAAIALQIDVARQLLDLYARIAEIQRQRQATEQDDEEAAMLLLAA